MQIVSIPCVPDTVLAMGQDNAIVITLDLTKMPIAHLVFLDTINTPIALVRK